MAGLCRTYGISRNTGHQCVQRFVEGGQASRTDHTHGGDQNRLADGVDDRGLAPGGPDRGTVTPSRSAQNSATSLDLARQASATGEAPTRRCPIATISAKSPTWVRDTQLAEDHLRSIAPGWTERMDRLRLGTKDAPRWHRSVPPAAPGQLTSALAANRPTLRPVVVTDAEETQSASRAVRGLDRGDRHERDSCLRRRSLGRKRVHLRVRYRPTLKLFGFEMTGPASIRRI